MHGVKFMIMHQVTPEAKKKAAEAKSRADDAFRRKDYSAAVDAYTQVCTLLLRNRSSQMRKKSDII